MDDLGIALVAFAGAIVGALVGFIALAWQHSAVRDEDIRKAGAQLLYHAEVARSGYLLYRQTSPSLRAQTDYPKRVEESMARVGELFRYIEVAASSRMHREVEKFVVATGKFQMDMDLLQANKGRLDKDHLERLERDWYHARTSLATDLRHPGAKPIRGRVRRLTDLVFNRS